MKDLSPDFQAAGFDDESNPLAPPPSNAAVAYQEIKRRIMDNVYMIGATVSMQETADLLRMSRTPIRDALIRLEEERLVKLVPRHGFQVLPISARDTADVYGILTALEVLAIEQLMESALSAEKIAELEAGVAGLEHALATGDLEAWARFDAIFHETLTALSGNRRLTELVRQFQDQTRRARRITLHLRATPEISTRNHRELVEAIKSGDTERACATHKAQRARSARELTGILKTLDIRHL
ncbi:MULTISPECIES: GntR family transcriptional regulator [Paraburkholderia]|uniref:GntR family transcriptional regulator n=1 Tax=Paraburkholderia TaxID=1822464 RepID=UPI0022590E76|nr:MULTISPECIES: GntR family transcriptional regulator [Paraburkholderia]MCX4163176.1 GntR family transcriptional regulator [Paraburkholderia megapolitana]MDN7158672.1 GntR family transcriptional regulator [Paraburkholderia sp. CHISQ3]MDQ6495719.1 GntR family transcriptional regulator [Paraburkholderia megapolitana]